MFHETLPEIPVFRGLSKKQIEELNGWLTRKEFNEGETIVREGAPPDGLYVIARGKLVVLKKTESGEIPIATFEGPSVLGEMGLLSGEGRSATAVAHSRVVAGHLPIDLFEEKLTQDNLAALRISYNLGCIVSHRMREALRIIAELTATVAKLPPNAESQRHVTKVLDSVYASGLLGKGH